jgi:hypothetical protein
MKTTKTIFAFAAGALLLPAAMAQEVIRETAPPSPAVVTEPAPGAQPLQFEGTIAQFGQNSISVRSEKSGSPVEYRYSNTTQWVDEAGNVVTRETVKTGAPVMVYYSNATDGPMVTKVVVRRQPGAVAVERPAPDVAVARETAGTTTTVQPVQVAGTVAQFGDSTIALRTQSAVAPVQYRFTQTTQWLDEGGNVVTRESVRTGVPVTLHYTKAADGLVVSKVVVRRQAAAAVAVEPAAPAPVAETTTDTVVTTVQPMEAAGTIAQFGEDFIALRTGSGANPVQYLYSDTTKWMDETGKVVLRDSVRTGVPVNVYYTKTAQGLVVSKVVVRRQAAPVAVERRESQVIESPAPKVIERRKAVTERRPAPKATERRKTVIEERPAVIEPPQPTVIEKPAPPVVEKETTTTTTTTEKKKKDDDDDDD